MDEFYDKIEILERGSDSILQNLKNFEVRDDDEMKKRGLTMKE